MLAITFYINGDDENGGQISTLFELLRTVYHQHRQPDDDGISEERFVAILREIITIVVSRHLELSIIYVPRFGIETENQPV